MDDRGLLEALDPRQREAVTARAAPLAILAGAGSGKTRVLTHRIAYQAAVGNLDVERVLALTFTRKAAAELRSRLGRLGVRRGVTAGTFHAIALAQLRQRAADTATSMPAILEWKGRVLGRVVPGRGDAARVARNEIAAEIEWAKARLVGPRRYAEQAGAAGRDPSRSLEEVADLYRRYEQEKQRRGLWDFDDLIWQCTKAIEDDPDFARVQRWRFRHLFVDEFQDTTHAQVRLLRAWLGPSHDLCAVGDPDQAIYGFAGADPGYLTAFDDHFPGGDSVRLDRNYRSTPQIVAAARAVLPRQPGVSVHAVAGDGPPPAIAEHASADLEARAVAGAIGRAHGPERPWSAFAVLYRVNAQSALFEQALRRAGIPSRVRGDRAFLDRPEVKAVLEDLRRAATQAPRRPLGEHLTDIALDAQGASEEQREHVDQVVALGREYLAAEGHQGSVAGFEAFLTASLRNDDLGPDRDAVELLTFHRAKGLEWDTVFVTGLEHGYVPIAHAKDSAEATAEERRLLYVALSRARRVLHLTWAAERALGARTVKRRPSPWLAEIQRVVAPANVPATPADGRSGPARARARLGAIETAELSVGDRPLYEALVAWRRDVARAADVPAYVVFDNKTLRCVAEHRPGSPSELLALPGIGPVKLERYGAALLEVVATHG